MGLLSRIAAGVEVSSPAEDSSIKNEGLTETSVTEITEVPEERLSFFDFTKKHSLSNTGVFTKNGVFYSFSASKGFDSDTVLQSLSTSDFWEGTIKENAWSIFSRVDNNLNTMLQFFSNDMKNAFSFVCVFQNEDHILLCAFGDEMPSAETLDAVAKDFKNTDCFIPFTVKDTDIQDKKIITADFSEAIDEITGKLAINIKKHISNAFTTESFYTLDKLLSGQNCIVKTDTDKISFTFDSQCHVSDTALEVFLNANFTKLFKTSASLIKYGF